MKDTKANEITRGTVIPRLTRILARVATMAARDRNIAALGKFGEKIPSNVNVWHHLPELRLLLPDTVSAED